MFKVLKNERVIMVDIDDTMVMHGIDKNIEGALYVYVKDPVDCDVELKLRLNEPMLRLVREELQRGSQICFWSRGGYQWALNVVTALGFDKHDQEIIVMTKPFAYFDDSPVDKWLVDRVYIGPDVVYKK